MRVHAFSFRYVRCVCGCVRPFLRAPSTEGDTVLKLTFQLFCLSGHICAAQRRINTALEVCPDSGLIVRSYFRETGLKCKSASLYARYGSPVEHIGLLAKGVT